MLRVSSARLRVRSLTRVFKLRRNTVGETSKHQSNKNLFWFVPAENVLFCVTSKPYLRAYENGDTSMRVQSLSRQKIKADVPLKKRTTMNVNTTFSP